MVLGLRAIGRSGRTLGDVSQPAEPACPPIPRIPAEGTADVWWARRADASPRLAGLLDPVERERWAGYRHDADRDRFVVGCALAKTVIAACTGTRQADVSFDRTCPECGRPHGKPALRTGALEFSVAHSGEVVGVAVARSPVGVDVEQLADRRRELSDPGSLARTVLAEPEQQRLAEVDPAGQPRAFLVAWARKEAVTKARGDGLRTPFSEVVVAAEAGPARLTAWPYPEDPRLVSLLDLDDGAGLRGRAGRPRPLRGGLPQGRIGAARRVPGRGRRLIAAGELASRNS